MTSKAGQRREAQGNGKARADAEANSSAKAHRRTPACATQCSRQRWPCLDVDRRQDWRAWNLGLGRWRRCSGAGRGNAQHWGHSHAGAWARTRTGGAQAVVVAPAQAELVGQQGQDDLNLAVPFGPVVNAGALDEFVGDFFGLEEFDEAAVGVEKVVFGAAIEIEKRKRLLGVIEQSCQRV